MIVGIAGYAGAGKDTAGHIFCEMLPAARHSFGDWVRSALYALNPFVHWIPRSDWVRLQDLVDEMGWDRVKRESYEVRVMLQRMGIEAGVRIHGDRCWIRLVEQSMVGQDVPSFVSHAVITDVRMAYEADWIRDRGGVIVSITRPGVGPLNTHWTEQMDDLRPDHAIVNDGSIEELRSSVARLCRYLIR